MSYTVTFIDGLNGKAFYSLGIQRAKSRADALNRALAVALQLGYNVNDRHVRWTFA